MESFEVFNPRYRSPWFDHWGKVLSSFIVGLLLFIGVVLFAIPDLNFRIFSAVVLLVGFPLLAWSVFIRTSGAFPLAWVEFISQKGDSPVLPSEKVKSVKVHTNFNLSSELCSYIKSERTANNIDIDEIWLKVAELYRIRNLEKSGRDVSVLVADFKKSLV